MQAQRAAKLAKVRSIVRSGAARSIRRAAGLSLLEMADAISCSPTTIHRWERGERVPHGDRAIRYLNVLEELMSAR